MSQRACWGREASVQRRDPLGVGRVASTAETGRSRVCGGPSSSRLCSRTADVSETLAELKSKNPSFQSKGEEAGLRFHDGAGGDRGGPPWAPRTRRLAHLSPPAPRDSRVFRAMTYSHVP